MTNTQRIDLLNREHRLDADQWEALFSTWTETDLSYAMTLAREIAVKRF